MQTIDATSLNDLLDREDDWLLVDVVPEPEFAHEHIPGSENVPADDPDFVERIDALAASRRTPVIVYDSEPNGASARVGQRLEKEGFVQVIDFADGLDGWKRAGLAVTGESED
ncbi:MAG: rhodanese-like domain-containing protein [Phycisphaerales bacterium JB039]